MLEIGAMCAACQGGGAGGGGQEGEVCHLAEEQDGALRPGPRPLRVRTWYPTSASWYIYWSVTTTTNKVQISRPVLDED